MERTGGRADAALAALGGFSVVGYGALALGGDLRGRLSLFLGCWVFLAALYVGALVTARRVRPTPAAVRLVITAAVLFRIAMLFSAPSLSDDIHRYVRDGWVQVNGHNPYAQSPDDPSLAPLRLADHSLINNPSVPTLYPPLSEALFAAVAFVWPSPYAIKSVLLVFDLATVLLLLAWLRRTGRSPLAVMVYAWHPLAVVEGAGSGHVDLLGAFLLVLAVCSIIGDRKFASSAALAGSVLAKLTPAFVLPFFLRRFKLIHIALFASVLIVVSGPYLAGAGGRAFRGLAQYATRWDFNGSLYPVLEAGLERLRPTEPLKAGLTAIRRTLHDRSFLEGLYGWLYPPYLARVLAAALLVMAIAAIALRNMAPEREVFLGLAALFLLSPTVHPWYLLWLLPFFVLLGAGPALPDPRSGHPRGAPPAPPGAPEWSGLAWLWLSLAVPFSYLAFARSGEAKVPMWVSLLEYGPMLPLALLARWSSGRARLVPAGGGT